MCEKDIIPFNGEIPKDVIDAEYAKDDSVPLQSVHDCGPTKARYALVDSLESIDGGDFTVIYPDNEEDKKLVIWVMGERGYQYLGVIDGGLMFFRP